MIYCVDVVKLCLINFYDIFEVYLKLVFCKISNIKYEMKISVFDLFISVIVWYLII